MEGEALSLLVARYISQMRRGKGHDCAHHEVARDCDCQEATGNGQHHVTESKGRGKGNGNQPWNLRGPYCCGAQSAAVQFDRQTSDVVDEAQIRSRKTMPDGRRALAQLGKRWDPREAPVLDFSINLRGGHEIGIGLTLGRFLAHRLDVHVVATAVVFCAVFAITTTVSNLRVDLEAAASKCTIAGRSRRIGYAVAYRCGSHSGTWYGFYAGGHHRGQPWSSYS